MKLKFIKIRILLYMFISSIFMYNIDLNAQTLNVYEGFDYASGTAVETTGATGFGWSSLWTGPAGTSGNSVASSSPLVYSGLSVTGNYMSHGGYSERINRRFTVPATLQNTNGFLGKPGTSVYLSFLFRKTVNTAGWYGNGPVVQLVRYSNQGNYDNEPNKLGVGVFDNKTAFQIASGGSTKFLSTTPFTLGTVYFVVVRYDFNASSTDVKVFINPSVSSAEPASPTFSNTYNLNYSFDGVYFGLGDGNNQANIDEIHVADTWDAVTPDAAAPTPLSGVQITNANAITTDGGEIDLTYTTFPANATTPISSKWSISDSRVAAISSTGKLTAISNGTVTVTLEAGNTAGPSVITTTSISISGQVNDPSALLAYEGFDITPNTSLLGSGSGFGWNGNWISGDNFTTFQVKNTAPLSYGSLSITGNYSDAAVAYSTSNRLFNLNTNFSSYSSNGFISKQGKTLWLSALMRAEGLTYSEVSINASNGFGSSNYQTNSYFGFGYFGNDSKFEGVDYLTLRYKANSDNPPKDLSEGEMKVLTSTPYIVGNTYFVVMKLTIGGDRSNSYIEYFINPTLGSTPTVPDYSFTLTAQPNIRKFSFTSDPISGSPGASFDEFRVGTSFESVVPLVLPSSIQVSGSNISALNGTAQISVNVTPSNALNSVNWTSSNSSIASISGTGLLKALDNGIVTITASSVSNGVSGIGVFTISGQAPSSINVMLSSTTTDGYNVTATSAVIPSDAANGVTWSSSNTSVATIDENGVITPLAAGVIDIIATSTANSSRVGSASLNVTQIKALSISVSGMNISEFAGSTTVTSIVLPNNTTDKSVTYGIISGDVTGVSINANTGVVSTDGSKNGVVTITAVANSNNMVMNTIEITISGQSPESISFNATNLSTTGFDFDATVTPADANGDILWSVIGNGGSINSITGEYLASTLGVTVTVVGSSAVNNNIKNMTTIYNSPKNLQGIATLTGSSLIAVNSISVYDYLYSPSDASLPIMANWTSSDLGIFTVDNGTVTGVGNGTATLTATVYNSFSTITGTLSITVVTPITSAEIQGESTVAIGQSKTYSTTKSPLTSSVISEKFMSSNTAIATITDEGVLTAVSAGVVTLTSEIVTALNTITSSAFVVTITTPISSVNITGNPSIIVGFSVRYNANINPSSATGPVEIMWMSSNESVATVNAGGTVTGVGGGSATITAIAMSPYSTVTGTRVVNVNVPTVALTSASISGINAILVNNMSTTLTGSYLPANATSPITYTWASSNQAIAKVSQNGVIEPVSVGQVNILLTVTGPSNRVTTSFTLNITTDISTKDKSSFDVSVYPNPVSDLLNISLSESASISILNSFGGVSFTTNGNKGSNQIDVSSLTKGIYLLQIQTSSSSKVLKLVID